MLNGASNEEVKDLGGLEQGKQYPSLEIVKSYEKRTVGECRIVNFKNIWASYEGEPRHWIKNIQDEHII